ncbi:hypothetical protein [Mucilaginibacter sp.]|uniref:hypothetical protein n=1 Tax=Mucilaginibacter sp. TaxID=1882438 RepID=UPI003263850E
MKRGFFLFLMLAACFVLKAQTLRTYDDTRAILTFYKSGQNMTSLDALKCLALLKPYLSQDQTGTVADIQTHLAQNPLFKFAPDFLQR